MSEIQYCDLVMKGGITSGIVYPSAALELSGTYTFKNIGGTSAGAIAAAACAAAALGERKKKPGRTGTPKLGFTGLRAVADELKKPGFIFSLFQPVREARAAFGLLVHLTAKPAWYRGLLAIVTAIVRMAPLEFIFALAVPLLLAWRFGGWPGLSVAALPILICALGLAAIAAVMRLGRIVRANQLGLCTGTSNGRIEGRPAALTEWLHEVLQRLSGKTKEPLLFSDLWKAPIAEGELKTERTINLTMITTAVSHSEPRSLPFEGSTFWFRPDEFAKLFPAAVVKWMVAQDRKGTTVDGITYHQLPKEGRLPVLVATRMSLSFPLLLSAVPLYEADWSTTPTQDELEEKQASASTSMLRTTEALAVSGQSDERTPTSMRLCWFSDGGISSNFPIHLFDAALPRWPTFAINLTYPDDQESCRLEDVFLPTENNQGWQRRYTSITSTRAVTEVSKFLFAIINTMQNWRDLLQSRTPGHRDRIVHVPLAKHEGGMNLNMEQAVIDGIADKGGQAGKLLAGNFDFDNHWWVRWRTVASGLERFTIEAARGAGPPVTPTYADAHSTAITGEPKAPSYQFTKPQSRAAQDLIAGIVKDGAEWTARKPNLTQKAPRPLPQLRIIPTF